MVHYDMIVIINKRGYSRKQSKKVNLKLYSSQNINNEFLNEAKEKQLGINKYDDIIIEWISYDKFDDIKELRKDEFSTIYSAIWKDGPLQYDRNKREYSREQSI
uniref:Uncharacterized protein n=1 Tax=Rhizophagus irregularis (strain DAOM 181602 / DAOM 197198 / MUCL 43194) TaxID=747089 RepID=U9UX78_RHIID